MAIAENIDRDPIVDVANVLRRGNVLLTVNYREQDGLDARQPGDDHR